MSWEAFLGAMLPSLLVLVGAIATYYKMRTEAEKARAAAEIAARLAAESSRKIDENTLLTRQSVNVSQANSKAIGEIHKEVNDRLSQLVKVSSDAAHARGVKEERDRN